MANVSSDTYVDSGVRRRVLLAGLRSFCAGVERAIEIVERALESRGAPVYVRKQIVHNVTVVEDLADRGAVFVDELDEVPDDSTVVFSAHGVSPTVREEATRRGLDVIDGTCPLVAKVHAEARPFSARGDTVVLVGHAGHEEIEGTMGEAPESMVLIQTADEVHTLSAADRRNMPYLTQTTLAVDETAEAVGVTVVGPRWRLAVSPALVRLAARHRLMLSVEDGVRGGGVGAAWHRRAPTPGCPRWCTPSGCPASSSATVRGRTSSPNTVSPHGPSPKPRSPRTRPRRHHTHPHPVGRGLHGDPGRARYARFAAHHARRPPQDPLVVGRIDRGGW